EPVPGVLVAIYIPYAEPSIVQLRAVTRASAWQEPMPLLPVPIPAGRLLTLTPLQSIVTLFVAITIAKTLAAAVIRFCRRHRLPGVEMTVGTTSMKPTQLS